MADNINQWMIKEASGRITGPYSTEKVLQLISNLVITGDEFVSLYPNGEWLPISKKPEFYDRLLSIISGEEEPAQQDFPKTFNSQSGQEVKLSEPEIVEEVQTPPPEVKDSHLDRTEVKQDETAQEQFDPPPSKKKSKRKKDPEVIELTDIKAHVKKQKRKKATLPFTLTLIVAIVGVAAFLFFEPKKEKLRLIAPRDGRPSIPASEGKTRFESAVNEFVKDTLDGYKKAMNILVPVAEGMPKNAGVLQLLCLTYRELWPFTYQDQADIKVVTTLVRLATGVDPGGVSGATCKAVDFILNGKLLEAKTLIEATIESSPTVAVLYELKGVIVGGGIYGPNEGDAAAGIVYMDKAIQLWPAWLKPRVFSATYLRRQNEIGQALQRLNDVLRANPYHDVARAIVGIISFKNLNKGDIAIEQILPIATSKQIPAILASEAQLTLAEVYDSRGEKNNTLKFAKLAYSSNPGNRQALNLVRKYGGTATAVTEANQQSLHVGDQYFAKGDFFAAQAEYKAAFEANPKNGLAALKAAKSLWRISQVRDAMTWLDKAIRANPDLIEAYVTKAEYYTERFDFYAAATVLKRAQQINKSSYEVYRGFAYTELKRNNPAGALTYIERALKYNGTDVQSHVIMAKAYMLQQKFTDAFRIAAKAIELENTSGETQDVYTRSLVSVQGVEAGVHYIKKIIETFPGVVDFRMTLADVLFQDEKYAEAEAVYRQVTMLENTKKEAFWGLGKSLQAQGRYKEAVDPLLKAAALDPGDANSMFILGQMYASAGQLQKAIQSYERVVDKNPLFPLAHLNLGKVAAQMGNYELALKEAMKEQNNNPSLPESYLLAAEVYSQQQRYTNCTSEIQKALKLGPQGAKIYITLAKCYRLSGSLDTALAMIRIAEERESGLPEVYLELGQIYEIKGETSSALSAYNQYLVLSPNAKDADQVRQKLNQLGR